MKLFTLAISFFQSEKKERCEECVNLKILKTKSSYHKDIDGDGVNTVYVQVVLQCEKCNAKIEASEFIDQGEWSDIENG